ncbi:MAG: hypothetical protein HRU40_06205 [Saprospiraceae bacterium]|nr:hypothetical protein [Saprospiraceae bacterium]
MHFFNSLPKSDIIRKVRSKHIVLVVMCISFMGCKQQLVETEKRDLSQEPPEEIITGFQNTTLLNTPKVSLESGMYIEQKPEDAIFFNYSDDNVIFVNGSEFEYAYVYLYEQDSLYVRVKENLSPAGIVEMDWELTPVKDDSTIARVKITPEVFSNIFGYEYKQTVIRYDYYNDNNDLLIGGTRSGCIENHKNVWIHPPRDFLFKMLNLNPYPFIQAPYVIGNVWEGELTIGNIWADVRWITWEDPITNIFTYEIIDHEILECEIGQLECLVISATAKSDLGETTLKSWFHFMYGFVKMEYSNIDNSKIHFNRVWNDKTL